MPMCPEAGFIGVGLHLSSLSCAPIGYRILVTNGRWDYAVADTRFLRARLNINSVQKLVLRISLQVWHIVSRFPNKSSLHSGPMKLGFEISGPKQPKWAQKPGQAHFYPFGNNYEGRTTFKVILREVLYQVLHVSEEGHNS
uniref:Uncharacterized protein n=1 Tax=Schistocephalus solidus TaxID=70667 RepID=A0A0X3NPQ3_SCHSO